MYHSSARRTPRLAACLLVLALSGCSSSSSPNEPTAPPDFEGTYAVTGTFAPRTTPNTGLFGSLVITNQSGTTATAAVAVKLLDNGNTGFALNIPDPGVSATASPGQAQLKSDGSFSLELSGREELFGIDPAACCEFKLRFTGKLSARTISGNWVLTTDMPSSDNGTFEAKR